MRTILWTLISGIAITCAASANPVESERYSSKAPRTVLPAGDVIVPMTLHEAQPVIEVMVNGQGPFKFLFDTGAGGHRRISAALADRLGLAESGEVTTGDPSGQNRQTLKLAAVQSISIGKAEFHDLELVRRDSKQVIDKDRGIDGILGFGVFAECLITLDYPGKRFVMARGELPADGSVAYTDDNGVPQIPISVGGVEVEADVDSGSMGNVAVPGSVADKLKLKREPVVVGKASTGFNQFEIRQAPLDGELRVGGQVLRDPSIEIFDIFPRANIGGQFLRNFSLAIDQPNKRLRFAASGEAGQAQPRYRVGMMLRRQGEEAIVDDLIPGGAAEHAGLQAGDRITHLNGRSLKEIDPEELGRLFGSPAPVELTISRGDAEKRLVVTPARAD